MWKGGVKGSEGWDMWGVTMGLSPLSPRLQLEGVVVGVAHLWHARSSAGVEFAGGHGEGDGDGDEDGDGDRRRRGVSRGVNGC